MCPFETPRYTWVLWDIAETLRKLVLAGFVLFIPAEYPMARLQTALLLSVTFLVFTLVAQPFKSRVLFAFSVASQLGLVFVFAACIVLKICEEVDECHRHFGLDSAFDISLVVLLASLGLLASMLLLLSWSLVTVRRAERERNVLRWSDDESQVEPRRLSQDKFHCFISADCAPLQTLNLLVVVPCQPNI